MLNYAERFIGQHGRRGGLDVLAYQVRAYATLALPLPKRRLGRYWRTLATAVLSYLVAFVRHGHLRGSGMARRCAFTNKA